MRNRSKTCCIFVVILISVTLFSSCSKVDSQTPVVIGINTWTGYDPFILAEQKKLFNKNYVRAEVRRFKSAQEEMQAMRDGHLQGAALTLDEAVSLHESGCRVKCVLVIDYSMGGDMLIGQKEIKSMKNLKTKRIGYEGTVVGEFLLQRALVSHQIKENDVKLIEIKAENWIAAFKERIVDALVCYNPASTTLLTKYNGNLLFSSEDIPFEIIDVLVFRESFFNRNKPAIMKITKTWFDTLDYMKSHFEDSVKIIASEKQITPDEFKQGLNGLVAPTLSVNKSIFDMRSKDNIFKYSQVIIDFMLSEGLLFKRVHTDDFFAPSILLGFDG